MTSEVDLCNLALSHLGDEAQVIAIVPPDGTMQAAHCATFYPIARDAVLQVFPWTFATRRAALAEVVNPVLGDYRYAYALPNGFLRPIAALYPGVPAVDFGAGATDTGSFAYTVESLDDGSLILYTNLQTAYLQYTARVTDTTKFPPLVIVAIARLLASYLAGPILKGDTGTKVAMAHQKIFLEVELPQAMLADARISKRDMRHYRPDWIIARGTTAGLPPEVTLYRP